MSDELKNYYREVASKVIGDEEEVILEFYESGPKSSDEFESSPHVRSEYRHDLQFRQPIIERQASDFDWDTFHQLVDADQAERETFKRIFWRLIGNWRHLCLSGKMR